MKKKKRYQNPKPVPCPNNEGVACLKPNTCAGCGWNPKVAQARKDRIVFLRTEGRGVKKLYIPEFWCGVLVAIGVEFISVLVIAFWKPKNKK